MKNQNYLTPSSQSSMDQTLKAQTKTDLVRDLFWISVLNDILTLLNGQAYQEKQHHLSHSRSSVQSSSYKLDTQNFIKNTVTENTAGYILSSKNEENKILSFIVTAYIFLKF